MTDVIQISTTTASRNDAENIAQHLLQAKLAACIQITGPLTSKYWWNGNIDSAEEWLCTIKTRGDAFARVERAIRENHPYRGFPLGDQRLGHGGTGSARSRAMRANICPNIRPDTVTSANWKVM